MSSPINNGQLFFVSITLTLMAGCASPPARMANWDIVIAADAPPGVGYAAEEFRVFFDQATGHLLPIVTQTDRRQRHVFIGPSAAMLASGVGFQTNDLGPDDLRIVVKEKNIAIAGGTPRGTIYGVYTYLEDYLGVRFLSPDHTHVPRLDASHRIAETNRIFRPVLGWRYCYYGPSQHNHAFAVRLRNNAITDDPRLGGKNPWELINHATYVSSSRYGKEHPEYFALVDGIRRANVAEDNYGEGGTQPCLSNPNVKQLTIAAVLKNLAQYPNRVNISVSQNDNGRYCRCDACQAIDDREGSQMGTVLELVNETAAAVEREHPGTRVGTLAYRYSRKPPKLLRPRPNVDIQLCSIEACLLHPINDPNCPLNAAFCRDLSGWGGICDRVFVWNYNVNFRDYLLPCPNLRVIGPNIRYFAANGVRGLFMQAAGGAKATELNDLRNYLICNLMWDPARDERVLMEEFIVLHYGKAAPFIREYINLIHNNAQQRNLHHNCFGRARDYGIDDDIAAQGLALFARAAVAAEDEVVRRRVEKASLCAYRAALEPLVDWLGRFQTDEKALRARPIPPELIKLRPVAQRFVELCDKYEVNLYSETQPMAQVKEVLQRVYLPKDQ